MPGGLRILGGPLGDRMLPSSILLSVELGVAAVLLVLLVVRPGMIRSVEGKVLAMVALFVAPAFAGYGGVTEHLDRTKSTSYCLSCHVMGVYGKSLRVDDPQYLAAAHYLNNFVPRERACYSCHTDYGMSGDNRSKARGFKHVLKTYFGSVPDTIKISRRYKGRECLRCHIGTRFFEESVTHLGGPVPMADIKSGKASCLKSGCHDLVHEVHELDQMAMWDPAGLHVGEARVARTRPGTDKPPDAVPDSVVTPDGVERKWAR